MVSFVSLFLFITKRPYSLAPKGQVYANPGKNYLYPSFIKQGQDGAWGVIDSHTTRKTPVVYTQLFFIFVGKIGHIVGIDAVPMFQLTQVASALFLFIAGYWFVTKTLPSKFHIPALLAMFVLENGPLLQTIKLTSIGPSWEGHMLIPRYFELPHHSAGMATGLLSLGFYFLYLKKSSIKSLLFMSFWALISLIILPPYITFLAACGVFPLTLWEITHKRYKHPLIAAGILVLLVGIVGLLMRHEFAKGLPWSAFTIAEKEWYTTTSILWVYAQSLIFYIPWFLALGVGITSWWKAWDTDRKRLVILLGGFIAIPIALIPFAQYTWFPFANFRLVDGYGYIPAGILVAITLVSLLKKQRILAMVAFVTTILLSLVCTIGFVYYIAGMQNILWPNVYPAVDSWKGILATRSLPKNAGIMTTQFYGEIIPAYANLRVYLGSAHNKVDWPERKILSQTFYEGKMETSKAKAFLKREDISYVYWGPDEQQYLQTPEFYPDLLTPVYMNSIVVVFKVVDK
jgi:hypothetical protein